MEGQRAEEAAPLLLAEHSSSSEQPAAACFTTKLDAGALAHALRCPVCLDTAQLPVSLSCFSCKAADQQQQLRLTSTSTNGVLPDTRGTAPQRTSLPGFAAAPLRERHSRAAAGVKGAAMALACLPGSGGCLRSAVCAHCANDLLQLAKPPSQRFPATRGLAACPACHEASVDARRLTPVGAYALNHSLMGIVDLSGLPALCRPCGQGFASQAALQDHYLRSCPAAVLACRFNASGCTYAQRRGPGLTRHEERCLAGRAVCQQCHEWVDKKEMAAHGSSRCRNRIEHCILCAFSAPLPDMLQHLMVHQQHMARTNASGHAAEGVAADKAAVSGPGAAPGESRGAHGSGPARD